MVTLANPHKYPSSRWWVHEGAVCEEDGHPQAALAAYGQAIEHSSTDLERFAAERLRDLLVQEIN